MKLQILVPHWQETYQDMMPLLESLMWQQGVPFNEFGVIIVYDGPEAPVIEYAHDYPYPITEVRTREKMGVSAARNLALDYAEADYVMFCDADDMFISSMAMYSIFTIIDDGGFSGFDMLTVSFLEEKRIGKLEYERHMLDQTFVHGKVFRRAFLIDNDIRFKPELTVHEDSFFVTVANMIAKNKIFSEDILYLWKYNPKSVSRNDPFYIPHTYHNLMESFDSIVEELWNRGFEDKSREFSWYIVCFSYHWLQWPIWEQCPEDLERAERIVAGLIEKHRAKWSTLTDEQKDDLDKGVPKMEGEVLVPFDEWFARLDSTDK